ncbi:hypothetical protein NDU88_005284 [Pleurodeles waltl]|uniref:Uncharacterized protein n=1 Tax=Pleurodeles waltl TaxID=8319 RepID=A0AAV7VLK9_PLEWA|nr:hypothetical protein NDU88_005284 [Pleurodeles waltl]
MTDSKADESDEFPVELALGRSISHEARSDLSSVHSFTQTVTLKSGVSFRFLTCVLNKDTVSRNRTHPSSVY